MASNERIVGFEGVTFGFIHNKPLLKEVDFSVRSGVKYTIMGQNGAGKSTILKLIADDHTPHEGRVVISPDITIATARQVMRREDRELTVRDFFQQCFKQTVYDIDPKIDAVLEVVNLEAPHDRLVKTFSGGQQARLLLASALIADPDLLLLDEPTNNLDKAGIAHLTTFLKNYKKTCIVISHDSDFLNAFTQGVLYLDVFTQKVEQYDGNYYDVQEQIAARIERENSANARLAKDALDKKEKANFFAKKGGRLRILAKRMREQAAEWEEEQVDVRREDRTIRPFTIPAQDDLAGDIVTIAKYNIKLQKNRHLRIAGPNGIGKTTLLEAIASGKGGTIQPGVKIGYYRQDFSTLDYEATVFDALASVMEKPIEHNLRSVAAGFLIGGDIINNKIGTLSEGQKGLVAFAQLVLMRPGLLILDEPTNHMNFRHLPVIAAALDDFMGAMILVSHVAEFVELIRIDETLELS